jgi:MFS family permease
MKHVATADRRGVRGGGASRVGGAVRSVGRALHFPVTGAARGIRKATHAHGAGESGLGKLIELHAVNGAGDVMITVALASTVFFSVPTDEARGRVALYLAITMAPFTVLAPVIGPLLDRLPHGRRAAMAGAMLARALLALVISGAVASGSLELYPAALGVLVASKAYGVVRSAVVPRLLPPRFSLVKANSRVTLAGLLATGVAAPVAAGLHQVGDPWPLYGAFVIFVAGTFLSFSLPPKVDSAKGEDVALLAADEQHLHGPQRRREQA